MFGGWQPGAGFYHPDQWEWDGSRADVDRAPADRRSRARASARRSPGTARAARAVLFGGFDEATGRRNDTWEWDAPARPGPIGRPRARSRRPRHSALMAFDSDAQQDRPLQRQHRDRGGDRRDLGRRDLGVGRDGGDVDADHRAGRHQHAVQQRLHQHGVRPRAQQDRPLLLLQLRLDLHGGSTAATGTWADVAPCRPRSIPRRRATTTPGWSTTPASRRWWCSAARARDASLWELTTTDFNWTNRSAPANGPIQRQYPSMAFDSKTGKLMVFGGRSSIDNLYKQDIWEWSGTDADADQPDHRRHEAGAALPGRAWSTTARATGCCCSAAPATTTYDDLWSWSPATREWTQISRFGHASVGALRPLDVLRRRSATRCTCSDRTRRLRRTGSTTRR